MTEFIYTSKIHSNQSVNYLSMGKAKQTLKNWKAFIDHSQTIDDVYENLGDYNPAKKTKSVNSVWWYDSRYGS